MFAVRNDELDHLLSLIVISHLQAVFCHQLSPLVHVHGAIPC